MLETIRFDSESVTRLLVQWSRGNRDALEKLTPLVYDELHRDQLMLTSNAQMQNDDVVAALNGYRDALEIFKGLAAADPTNAEAQRDLSFVYFRLAQALAEQHNAGAARDNYSTVLRIDERLLAEDPTNEEDTRTEVATYQALSELSEAKDDLPAAIESYRQLIGFLEDARKKSSDTYKEYALASNLSALGGLYTRFAKQQGLRKPQQLDAWRKGRESYEESRELFRELKNQGASYDSDGSLSSIASAITACDAALRRN